MPLTLNRATATRDLASSLSVGDWVQYGDQYGQIEAKVTGGDIADSSGNVASGTASNPVFLVRRYSQHDDGQWDQTRQTENKRASELTRIEALPAGDVVTEDAVEIEADEGMDLHIGPPTPAQLERICMLTGFKDWKAEDWFIVPYLASDNLVDRSNCRWHLNVLAQMLEGHHGRVLIANHDSSDIAQRIGFLFDSAAVIEADPEIETITSPNRTEKNQQIVEDLGLVSLVLWGAIHVNQGEIIQSVLDRSCDNVSTGGLMTRVRQICPNCTAELGYEVGFYDLDEDDDYICPHLPPSYWYTYFLGEDHPLMADYIVMDGTYDALELSQVQAGCLPRAKVIRGGQL